jgi:hypothetical protein
MARKSTLAVLLGVVLVAAAATVTAGEGHALMPIFSKNGVPSQIDEAMSGTVKPAADAPSHAVVKSEKIKLYNASWARLLSDAKDMAEAAGADGIVVTDWGFDPGNGSSYKKTERLKKVEFDIVTFN